MRHLLLVAVLSGTFSCFDHDDPQARGDGDDAGTTADGAASGDPARVEPYPLDTCLIMNVPLNAMGGAQRLIYAGQEWKFCCRGCVATFRADPERWQAELAAVLAEEKRNGGGRR